MHNLRATRSLRHQYEESPKQSAICDSRTCYVRKTNRCGRKSRRALPTPPTLPFCGVIALAQQDTDSQLFLRYQIPLHAATAVAQRPQAEGLLHYMCPLLCAAFGMCRNSYQSELSWKVYFTPICIGQKQSECHPAPGQEGEIRK
jgi:hypothetical protein